MVYLLPLLCQGQVVKSFEQSTDGINVTLPNGPNENVEVGTNEWLALTRGGLLT